MDHRRRVATLLQHRDHLLFHHPHHLEGYARHRHEDGIVSLEPHTRRGTVRVQQYLAIVRHLCLLYIYIQHRALEAREDLPHILQRRFVQHQFAAEVFAKCVFGNIILGRAQSAGDQHQVGSFFRIGQGI